EGGGLDSQHFVESSYDHRVPRGRPLWHHSTSGSNRSACYWRDASLRNVRRPFRRGCSDKRKLDSNRQPQHGALCTSHDEFCTGAILSTARFASYQRSLDGNAKVQESI